MLSYVLGFLAWTFVIYWMHRLAHAVSWIKAIHFDHHRYVNKNHVDWHWSNLFLFNDTWLSTLDLWITEVIPTILLSLFFGWWLFVCYYVWAAFIQERIEHNVNFNLYPWFTGGEWHMVHHKNARYNFGVFIPIWDKLFGTERTLNEYHKQLG